MPIFVYSDNGSLTKNFRVPDSITSYIIHGYSVSQDYGLCISRPERITTFKDFFIDLEIPYSIVRLEQVEVRATVYNYMDITLPVSLSC